MRRALVLIVVAVLAAACGKKAAPTGVKSPAPDPQEPGKATGDADGSGMESAPAPTKTTTDPCEGGETNPR